MHSSRLHHLIFSSSCLLLWITANGGLAQSPKDNFDWPQFLGPNRNGISAETQLIDEWSVDGPKIVWRVPGGAGMSGLAISRGRLVTIVQKEGQQKLLALSATTGELAWEMKLAAEYRNDKGNGPRATPTISGDFVIAYTGDGTLAAARFSDGGLLWSKNVLDDLHIEIAEYGMVGSPLVSGDRVYVVAGLPDATVAAYDIANGELVWKSGTDPAGYSSPALLDVGGRRQLVAFTGASVVGLDPATGSILWRYPYVTDFDCNIATPLAVGDRVFISSGENHGSVLLGLSAVSNAFQVTEVWKSQGPKSVMRNEWQTSMLLDGHLYGFDNVGGAGPVSHLNCVEAATGKLVWQKLRFGKGNLIAADGKLFISNVNGELVVVRASSKAFEEIGRKKILAPTRQAPALANGLLYMRDSNEIVCVDVRRGNGSSNVK